MATNRIKVRSPFKDLFPVDEKTVDAVSEHMRENGYDQSQPIVVWKEKLEEDRNQAIIIDGHTRLAAARKIGLSPVYVARVSFPDEKAAIEYAIHNQRDRRNLTDADLIRCIEAVDKRSSWGGDRKSEDAKIKSSSEPLISSAKATAEMVGTSETKVKKARTIIDHAGEATKQAVRDGEKSIHAAAMETQKKRGNEPEQGKNESYKIQRIRALAKIMMDYHHRFKVVKPDVKRYCKHPLATEESVKAVDWFLDWAEAWLVDLADVLAVKKTGSTYPEDMFIKQIKFLQHQVRQFKRDQWQVVSRAVVLTDVEKLFKIVAYE